jgi:CBS domain-containing protein
MKRQGLATSPDFEYTWLDGTIEFIVAPPDGAAAPAQPGAAAADPTFRIGRLDAANRAPVSVKPDASLQQAVTIMLTNDFSQLPVMTGPRDLKGIISWKTIGSRLALKRPCPHVRDAMEPAQVVSMNESLFDAIARIASHDYVLVQAEDKTYPGIVTASDYNAQFQSLAEPFLLVGEIENGLRRILHQKFTLKELEEATAPGEDGRVIESPSDLTFGEYIRLIEPEKRWKKLRIEIDRVEFLERLNRVREVRNDVMHFDPDGLDPVDLVFLREFAQFLKRLRDVGAV